MTEEINRITIIEDDKNLVNLIRYNLAKTDREISVAYDGEQALELIKHKHPDLIILDLMLPKVDGYEVLRILKEDKSTSSIPVIILSAKVTPGAIIKGFKMGALDYIPKPFSVGEVISKVERVLEQKIRQKNQR